MTNIITELCNGGLNAVGYAKQDTPEIKELENLLHRNLNTLEETLNEKESAYFKKYNDCLEEYLLVTNEQAFYNGFCLGARILAEALIGAGQIV